MTPDFTTLTEEHIPPNGAAVLAVVNGNITHNMRLGIAGSVDLLSTWRIANVVVNELTPLVVFGWSVTP